MWMWMWMWLRILRQSLTPGAEPGGQTFAARLGGHAQTRAESEFK
jgi:hypothetical protein